MNLPSFEVVVCLLIIGAILSFRVVLLLIKYLGVWRYPGHYYPSYQVPPDTYTKSVTKEEKKDGQLAYWIVVIISLIFFFSLGGPKVFEDFFPTQDNDTTSSITKVLLSTSQKSLNGLRTEADYSGHDLIGNTHQITFPEQKGTLPVKHYKSALSRDIQIRARSNLVLVWIVITSSFPQEPFSFLLPWINRFTFLT